MKLTPLIAILLIGSALPASSGPAANTLADIERRLSADADNLELANAYRREVIVAGEYNRALRFFEDLIRRHPQAVNARLNYGFAYVDKIPASGSITQVILANSALNQFTRVLKDRPSWIGYYTRGASYLFWPKVFGRLPLGIADLEQAMRMQHQEPKRSYHVRTYIALGDGHWKVGDTDRARAIWHEGLQEFPGNRALTQRVGGDDVSVSRLIEEAFDPMRRVDTDLSELWAQP